MGYIYKIVEKESQKPVYVGQTIKTLEERWKEHLTAAFNTNRNNSFAIHNAIKKYGREFYKIVLIEETEQLNEREKFWIKELKTHITVNGYNMTWGGEHSSENLKKRCYQYDDQSGIFLQEFNSVSDAARSVNGATGNITKALSGKLHRAYGYRWSYVKYDVLPPPASNCTGSPKTVYQYDLNHNLIAVFPSATAAGKSLNKKEGNISMAALGQRKTAYGYIWSYSKLKEV